MLFIIQVGNMIIILAAIYAKDPTVATIAGCTSVVWSILSIRLLLENPNLSKTWRKIEATYMITTALIFGLNNLYRYSSQFDSTFYGFVVAHGLLALVYLMISADQIKNKS